MSPIDQPGAVRRELTTAERDGVELRRLIVERTYPAPIEEVWDALTNPERIPRWFLPVTGDLRLGGRYQLEGNAGGTVLACDPPRASASPGSTAATSAGWAALTDARRRHPARARAHAPVDPEPGTQFGPGAVGLGWDLALVRPGRAPHDRRGRDPAAAAAWAATRRALRFMTGEQRRLGAGQHRRRRRTPTGDRPRPRAASRRTPSAEG